MNTSPFKFGVTVSEASFANRTREIQKLYENLTQGVNTAIISPRRWGKSSLVEKVIQEIRQKEKGIKIAVIDLFSATNEEEFLELFARESIKASSGKWEEWMQSGKRFFKQLVPKFSVGIDPATDFSVSFDWSELKKHQDEILNLPEKMAAQKKVKFIVCLDEFQNLASYPDYEKLEKKMRSVWQRQKHVTYCLYGSKRHMMTDLFNSPSKPFYRFGDILPLDKIATEHWVAFIRENFSKTGKSIDDKAAEMIPFMMKNHSWYVQQLAHYTWQLTAKKASRREVEKALEELIHTNMPFYQKEIERLSATQLNLLKAIQAGEYKLTASAVMQTYRLGTPRNVSKNKTKLINADIIHDVQGKFEFLDPAFEKWFLKQYHNKSFYY